jgi:hypothetical protein
MNKSDENDLASVPTHVIVIPDFFDKTGNYLVVPQKLCNAYYYKVMIKSDGVKFASYL